MTGVSDTDDSAIQPPCVVCQSCRVLHQLTDIDFQISLTLNNRPLSSAIYVVFYGINTKRIKLL